MPYKNNCILWNTYSTMYWNKKYSNVNYKVILYNVFSMNKCFLFLFKLSSFSPRIRLDWKGKDYQDSSVTIVCILTKQCRHRWSVFNCYKRRVLNLLPDRATDMYHLFTYTLQKGFTYELKPISYSTGNLSRLTKK